MQEGLTFLIKQEKKSNKNSKQRLSHKLVAEPANIEKEVLIKRITNLNMISVKQYGNQSAMRERKQEHVIGNED